MRPTGRRAGFARVVSDVHTVSYLADVYVIEEARGRGFGLELVRFTVDEGAWRGRSGSFIRATCTGLYAKLGFVAPGERLMERGPTG